VVQVKNGSAFTITAENDDKTVTKDILIPKNVKTLTVGIPIPEAKESIAITDDTIPASAFNIQNIYFDFDKSNIRADAVPVMTQIINILKEYPTLKLEVYSHTDSHANAAYNVGLSQRRMKDGNGSSCLMKLMSHIFLS